MFPFQKHLKTVKIKKCINMSGQKRFLTVSSFQQGDFQVQTPLIFRGVASKKGSSLMSRLHPGW